MEKFYDNIDIVILVEEAEKLEYPTILLSLGLHMHMAPRGLRFYGYCPGQVLVGNGIIAGCTQSTTYTKISLHAVLQGFWDKYQTRILLGQASLAEPPVIDADMRSFIDDMSMATYGQAPAMYEVHAHMGEYLTKELRARKGKYPRKPHLCGRCTAINSYYKPNIKSLE